MIFCLQCKKTTVEISKCATPLTGYWYQPKQLYWCFKLLLIWLNKIERLTFSNSHILMKLKLKCLNIHIIYQNLRNPSLVFGVLGYLMVFKSIWRYWKVLEGIWGYRHWRRPYWMLRLTLFGARKMYIYLHFWANMFRA